MQFPRPLQQVYHESLHIVNYSRLENYTSESNLTFKFKLNDFMNSHVAAVDLFPVWYEGITQMTRSLEQQVQVLQSLHTRFPSSVSKEIVISYLHFKMQLTQISNTTKCNS